MIVVATVFSVFTASSAAAQNTPKPSGDSAPSKTTTVDAWRDALPQSESQTVIPTENGSFERSAEETFERIEKRLTTLEHKWMEAVKIHDATALKGILSEEFMLAGESSNGALSDRTQYLDHTVRDAKVENYNFDKLTVRVYGTTAIVSVWGKQQTLAANQKTDASFLYTDVWVKEGTRWRVVMRHSGLPGMAR